MKEIDKKIEENESKIIELEEKENSQKNTKARVIIQITKK